MSDLHAAIADFLAGVRSPETDRVRDAVRAPKSDPEVDQALAEYHRRYASPVPPEGVKRAVKRVRARESWSALYGRLVTHCQQSLTDSPKRRTAAETEVSTVITTHLELSADEKRENLKNRRLLWPVLLEITARRMGAELTPTLAASETFGDHLTTSLRLAFGKAEDKSQRDILRDALFGVPLAKIVAATGEMPEDVEQTIGLLHDRLREVLPR